MLSTLSVIFNNSVNIFIDLISNETFYNFKIRDMFLLFNNEFSNVNLFDQRLKYRRKIVDVTIFANVKTKIYYNV